MTNARILVVDDEPQIRRVMRTTMATRASTPAMQKAGRRRWRAYRGHRRRPQYRLHRCSAAELRPGEDERVPGNRPPVASGPQGHRQVALHDHDRLLRDGLAGHGHHLQQQPEQQLCDAPAATMGGCQADQRLGLLGWPGMVAGRETTKGLTRGIRIPPASIDPQYVAGFVWTRQYSFRVSKDIGNKAFVGVSAENAETLNPAGTIVLNPGTTILSMLLHRLGDRRDPGCRGHGTGHAGSTWPLSRTGGSPGLPRRGSLLSDQHAEAASPSALAKPAADLGLPVPARALGFRGCARFALGQAASTTCAGALEAATAHARTRGRRPVYEPCGVPPAGRGTTGRTSSPNRAPPLPSGMGSRSGCPCSRVLPLRHWPT